MKTYTIKQKMSGTGSIHDVASDQYDREIKFAGGAVYAVVLASYYGGRGYTTHRTAEAAIRADRRAGEYSRTIIDAAGHVYSVQGEDLYLDHGVEVR